MSRRVESIRTRWTRRGYKLIGLLACGGGLLQLTACFGSDPQFYFTNVIVNTLASNLIGVLLQSLLGGAAA